MTDLAQPASAQMVSKHTSAAAKARLAKRYAAEARFKFYGILAIGLSVLMLLVLMTTIVKEGSAAFVQTFVTIQVTVDPAEVKADALDDPSIDYRGILLNTLYQQFGDNLSRTDRRVLRDMISTGSGAFLRDMIAEDPSIIGRTVSVRVPAGDDIDQLYKGTIDRTVAESNRRVKDDMLLRYDQMVEKGMISSAFNTILFTASDSNEPELAGILGALVGSILTLSICFALAVPIGVSAAVYLEEFAPKNKLTDFIEVNINNLAAVPSIVFGLLGLAVFLQFFGLPRSAPLVGGLVLALIVLPTIIISTRAAIKAVPPSIRDAALGLGASRLQAIMHHTLPLAMPGIMTGTIIGMAHALGETAPLLMIGMVAFITTIPAGFTDAATLLPVQVFLWADRPERMFVERTSAAILVLLVFLIVMNGTAVYLRKKFERRW
jgi:phosphate transport system permease protein